MLYRPSVTQDGQKTMKVNFSYCTGTKRAGHRNGIPVVSCLKFSENMAPKRASNMGSKTNKFVATRIGTEDLEAGLFNGKYVITPKEGGSSEVWSLYKVVLDAITNLPVGYAQCNECHQFLINSSSSGVSSSRRHSQSGCKTRAQKKKGKGNGELKKRMTRLCVKLCGKDSRPFNVVSGEGFKDLLQECIRIGATHGEVDVRDILPTPRTVSRNVAAITDQLREKVVPEVARAMKEGRCSCTSDMWAHKHTNVNYVAVTGHFISDDWSLRNVLLVLNEFPRDDRKTGENIFNEVGIPKYWLLCTIILKS